MENFSLVAWIKSPIWAEKFSEKRNIECTFLLGFYTFITWDNFETDFQNFELDGTIGYGYSDLDV